MTTAGDSSGAPAAVAAGLMQTLMEAGMRPARLAFDEMKANAELVAKMNQMAAKSGRSAVALQSTALQETFEALSALANGGDAPKDMASMNELQRRCAHVCMERGVAHMRASLDAAQELVVFAFDIAKARLDGAARDAGHDHAGDGARPAAKKKAD